MESEDRGIESAEQIDKPPLEPRGSLVHLAGQERLMEKAKLTERVRLFWAGRRKPSHVAQQSNKHPELWVRIKAAPLRSKRRRAVESVRSYWAMPSPLSTWILINSVSSPFGCVLICVTQVAQILFACKQVQTFVTVHIIFY